MFQHVSQIKEQETHLRRNCVQERVTKSSPFIFSKPNLPNESARVANKLDHLQHDPFVAEDFHATPLQHYSSKQSFCDRVKKIGHEYKKVDERGKASSYFAFKDQINQTSSLCYTSTPQTQFTDSKVSVLNEAHSPICNQVSPILMEASPCINLDKDFHYQPRLMIGKNSNVSEVRKRRKSTDHQHSTVSCEALSLNQSSPSLQSFSDNSFQFIATKIPNDRMSTTETDISGTEISTGSSLVSQDSCDFPSLKYQGVSVADKPSMDVQTEVSLTDSSAPVGLSSLSRYRKRLNSSMEKFELENISHSSTPNSQKFQYSTPSFTSLEDDFVYKPPKVAKVTLTKGSECARSEATKICQQGDTSLCLSTIISTVRRPVNETG